MIPESPLGKNKIAQFFDKKRDNILEYSKSSITRQAVPVGLGFAFIVVGKHFSPDEALVGMLVKDFGATVAFASLGILGIKALRIFNNAFNGHIDPDEKLF